MATAAEQRAWRASNPVAAAAANARYYAANRDALLAAQKSRSHARHAAQRTLLNALKNEPCVDCGVVHHPAAMEFDHVRGVKKYEIRAKTMSRKDLPEELAKCDLRCANCHRTRHAVEDTTRKPKR